MNETITFGCYYCGTTIDRTMRRFVVRANRYTRLCCESCATYYFPQAVEIKGKGPFTRAKGIYK